ncbi:hypothetical protein ACIKTA_15120, partial [Hansschlegelia beijingensis]
MSVVLYLLGAGLLAWSGVMLLQGDAFATLDIATRLAGSGVLAIGLGAVTGAIQRFGMHASRHTFRFDVVTVDSGACEDAGEV